MLNLAGPSWLSSEAKLKLESKIGVLPLKLTVEVNLGASPEPLRPPIKGDLLTSPEGCIELAKMLPPAENVGLEPKIEAVAVVVVVATFSSALPTGVAAMFPKIDSDFCTKGVEKMFSLLVNEALVFCSGVSVGVVNMFPEIDPNMLPAVGVVLFALLRAVVNEKGVDVVDEETDTFPKILGVSVFGSVNEKVDCFAELV